MLDRALKIKAPIPTNMAINKITYFLFERVFIEDRRPIFKAKIEAWEHGPVVRELYAEFRKYGDGPIVGRAHRFSIISRRMEVATDPLDDDDERRFSEIVDHYLPMSGSTLRTISHIPESPWFNVWTYKGASNPGMEISLEVIADSFRGYRVHS